MLRRISVLLFTLFLITGCGSGTDDSTLNEQAVENENTSGGLEQPSVKAEAPSEAEITLNNFVLQERGQTLQYNGLAEYGHHETLQEVQQAANGQIYVFHGVMNDGTGRTDEDGVPFSFQREIHVTERVMKSSIESEQYEDIRTSLLSERILLQKPLEVNQSWMEQVRYDGVTHDAVSTITSMNESEDGNMVITVETLVHNMEGYPDKQYKERIKLEEGKGLISFENNDINYSPPLTEDGYTFGYGLSIIQ